MADIKIRLSDPVRLGEFVEVKTLALAPALADPEAGFDAAGVPIPHYVGFEAAFAGRPLLRIDLEPGVSRDPMISFAFRLDRAGELLLRWTVRDGSAEERRLAGAPAG